MRHVADPRSCSCWLVVVVSNEPGPGQYNPVVKSPNIRAITFGSGPQRPPAGGSKYDIKPGEHQQQIVMTGRHTGSTRHAGECRSASRFHGPCGLTVVLLWWMMRVVMRALSAPNKYMLPSAMGPQPSSVCNSSPCYSFGAR